MEIDDIDLDDAIQLIQERIKQNDDRINKYLFYHKENDIEYIVNSKENRGKISKYIMIRDTKQKMKKPTFYPFSNDIDVKILTFSNLKALISKHKEQEKSKREVTNRFKKASSNESEKKTTTKKELVHKVAVKKETDQETEKEKKTVKKTVKKLVKKDDNNKIDEPKKKIAPKTRMIGKKKDE
jgi:hypothetical protein